MNPELRERLSAALGDGVASVSSVSGGDINAAFRVMLRDGRGVFVKSHHKGEPSDRRFIAEADGLRALHRAAENSGLRIPRVLAVGDGFLALEYVDFAHAGPQFEERLGHGLAQLHRHGTADAFGFPVDNHLGRLPQDNTSCSDWVAFWRERRLLPLLVLLPNEPDVQRLGRQLADRLDKLLEGPAEPPTLIHGDLWSGNAAADHEGNVYLFDPACYHAHREAEFGMTRLFGFGRRFEAAYHAAYPLADGWERRVEVYRLHHLLSHLWHFGGSYRDGCLRTLRELLR